MASSHYAELMRKLQACHTEVANLSLDVTWMSWASHEEMSSQDRPSRHVEMVLQAIQAHDKSCHIDVVWIVQWRDTTQQASTNQTCLFTSQYKLTRKLQACQKVVADLPSKWRWIPVNEWRHGRVCDKFKTSRRGSQQQVGNKSCFVMSL